MKRRRFLRGVAWLAGATALGAAGCSSGPTEPTPVGQEADSKEVADAAAANDKAGRGNAARRKSRSH